MTQNQELLLNGEDRTAEIQEFAKVIGLDAAAPGRYSVLLSIEMFAETMLMQRMNPAKVLREIRTLEAGSESAGMKPATQFKRAPLRGLWHKHYQQDGLRSMAINLQNALKHHGLPWFEDRVREAQAAGEDRYVTEEDVRALTHDAVMGNWLRQSEAGKLTGEWIIYARHEDRNYYLCLGKHDSGDEALRKKIENVCLHEFPFLESILA